MAGHSRTAAASTGRSVTDEQNQRMNPGPPPELLERKRTILVCFLLAIVTGVVYWQIRAFDFINFDDPYLIYQNPNVNGGLTWRGILWALGTSYYEYWHPLTW